MKLSTRSEYACLALIDLSENLGKELVNVRDIAERKRIPRKYLEQILLALKRAGYLRSRRGADGGYALSRKPGEITLAEIIRLMDGALAPIDSVSEHFFEHTAIEQNPKITELLREIRDYISEKLENTTFKDLIG